MAFLQPAWLCRLFTGAGCVLTQWSGFTWNPYEAALPVGLISRLGLNKNTNPHKPWYVDHAQVMKNHRPPGMPLLLWNAVRWKRTSPDEASPLKIPALQSHDHFSLQTSAWATWTKTRLAYTHRLHMSPKYTNQFVAANLHMHSYSCTFWSCWL